MAEEQKQKAEPEKKKDEDWMQKKWRPAMGWMYMLICTLDMGIFPILWAVIQTLNHQPLVQWSPLTLQGAGLFHIAMGAVLGISAFGRTQEKLGGANNGGAQPTTGFASGPSTFGQPQSGFGGTPGGFGSPAPSTAYTPAPSWGTSPIAATPSPVVSGFGGKAAPVIPPFPEL